MTVEHNRRGPRPGSSGARFEEKHGIPWKGLGEYSREELLTLGWTEEKIEETEAWIKNHPLTVRWVNKVRADTAPDEVKEIRIFVESMLFRGIIYGLESISAPVRRLTKKLTEKR